MTPDRLTVHYDLTADRRSWAVEVHDAADAAGDFLAVSTLPVTGRFAASFESTALYAEGIARAIGCRVSNINGSYLPPPAP